MKLLSFLRDRLGERSTWMLFSAAVASAAALSMPWSAIFCAFGIVGALVPDKPAN